MPRSEKADQWLTLTEASGFLGVHPTTLRTWADQKRIHTFRTPGGHRRFHREELRRFVASGQGTDLSIPMAALTYRALAETKSKLTQPSPVLSGWHDRYRDEISRAHKRETGRRLLGLTIQYVVGGQGQDAILAEGCALARFYGLEAAEQGLSPSGVARAFAFFRDTLKDTIQHDSQLEGTLEADRLRIQLDLGRFFDEMLLAALEGYEEHGGSRRDG